LDERIMTVLDDAITLYRAAATLLSNVSQRRIDLLQSASSSVPQSRVLFEGYRSFGPSLAVCIPRGARATLAFQSPQAEGAVIESDLPEWMTLEGWLPDRLDAASQCFVETEAQSTDAVMADAFIREIDADDRLVDSPAREFRIQTGRVSVLKLDLPEAEDRRRKVIVHLRRPPAELALRQFALIPV